MRKLVLYVAIALLFAADAGATEPDKEKHAIAGAAIGLVATLYRDNAGAGISWGCLAGGLKEAYDAAGKGDPDFKDFIYTCAAAVITGTAVYYAVPVITENRWKVVFVFKF